MCDNLKPDRIRCEACRTINLAKELTLPKPNMEMYEKCSYPKKINCCSPEKCVTEFPVNPTCIKVCTKEEYMRRKSGIKPLECLPKTRPYTHGKLMWAMKAATLAGALYFTYDQGVWGDQQDVTECVYRWKEYVRSMSTRRPPAFDQCGMVIRQDPCEPPIKGSSLVAPIYQMYKEIVTACFSGVVKVPLLIKCAYLDYLAAMEKKWQEQVKERAIKRRG